MNKLDPWWYYLHTNGDLIAKRFRPEPSDFVRMSWIMRPDERETGYILLVEAACLGAKMSRVLELAKSWNMDGDDGLIFCNRMGFICEKSECAAGHGFDLRHKEDDEERTHGWGSSPLLALISYTRAGDFGKNPGHF